MIQETRYKSVVIPRINGKFLAVRDAKNRETTFVVGGCKKIETARACALRELWEETYGALGRLDESMLRHRHTFYSRDRSKRELNKDIKEGKVVTMEYNVFFIDVDIPWSRVQDQFYKNLEAHIRMRKKIETDRIYLMSREDFNNSRNMWQFMRNNVLPLL